MRFTGIFTFGLAAAALFQGCGAAPSDSDLKAASSKHEKIAILLASHGDIDDAASELEDYIKISFKKNVGIPLPFWSRDVLTGPAYALSVGTVRSQYDIIGPTNYRAKAELQAQAVDKALAKAGLRNVKTYLGYNFARPLIEETMAQMQADGVTTIVLFNKGAQFSYASSGENMEDVLKYLKDHPEYDVKVLAYRQYSDDDRFHTVMANAIKADAKAFFPGVAPQDICIMIGSHGLPQWMLDNKDPAIDQMVAAFQAVSKKLPGYRTYHAYLNDDFIPGAKWISPKASVLAPTLKKDGCKNVLMDGRLSFTNHHRATLYDMDVEVRGILEAPAKLRNGKVDPDWVKPHVVLAPNFDGDPAFGKLIVDLTKQALAGKGPIVKLKETGEKALPPLSVGKVGVDPFFTN